MVINARDTMGGLAKGLLVIETFTADRPRQSIAEVSAASGLDRATARRCLLTLTLQGYADYDGKFFTLTPRVLRLGSACLATMPLPRIVQPLLNDLSERVGQSSSLAILDGTEIVYVARAAQRKLMSISLMPGSRLPTYCTSMGRVLLAALPAGEAAYLLGRQTLAPRTPLTCTETVTILAELVRIRAQGFALIDQEVELGLRSIAVPILNARKQVVAAVNIGVGAFHPSLDDLITAYLPELQALQTALGGLLR